MSYIVSYTVPYEGITELHFDSLEKVANWIENNEFSYNYNYDNITIRLDAPEISVYALYEGTRKIISL